MKKVSIPIVRTLQAIRRIGYTPVSAILDIVDNSIVAKANFIEINIVTQADPEKPLKRIINKITIIDNGCGMTPESIYNSLTLGSPDSTYEDNSLSKFGFGLKSAGLSQGDRIEVISRNSKDKGWIKCALDFKTICLKNEYVIFDDLSINQDDVDLLERELLKNSTGTIIHLKDINQVNDISPNKIISNLEHEVSLTYHRFIEKGLKFIINGKEIAGRDPLFLEEISEDISKYNGTKPCSFFHNPVQIALNPKTGTTMKVNAVQLPYPPMFQKEGKQKEIQTKYLMYLKNIGFYVYRNDRLIAKGLKLDLVTADYNYMAFRASIDLFTNSDDDVNLDVSKSQVILPDYAWDSLHERINPVIKMSKELWNIAGKKNSDPNIGKSEIAHQRSNVLLSGTKPVIVDAEKGEIKPVQGIVKGQSDLLLEKYGINPKLLEQLKGKRSRIVVVDELPDIQLWKPGIDIHNDCEVIVYLSRAHPFYEHIYGKLDSGDDALVILDALFLNLAMVEMSIVATDEKIIKVFEKVRTSTSVQLSNFIEVKLFEI